jgi:acetylornithine deacetylase/succinyl-diaminopimelate desuccinylase-like protein
VPELDPSWLEELAEFLSIPSVSADPAHADDVRRAAEWVSERVCGAGGEAELVELGAKPLVVGEIRASSRSKEVPTVLVYGHFDVQPPDPLDLWESEPFELAQRDGWLYARGIADDKGQLYMLLKAAELLAREGSLPVNIRVACDGEEESGGHSIVDFLERDERSVDACVIFDGAMLRRGLPTFYVATRGLVYLHLRVRTGERDLHSGVFGGSALNAMHALTQILAAVLPRDGRLPEPLRAGIVPPSTEELENWEALDPGAEVLRDRGARPADPRAAEEFYLRTWAEPSLDVNGVSGGSPHFQKTVLPVLAEANLSIRLAAGQSVDEIRSALEQLLREAAPAGTDVEPELLASGEPGLVSPDEPAVQLALAAFERVVGTRPLLVRSGGSLPIIPALARKGIPTVLTGFDVPEGNIHSPNERLLADYLPLGIGAARELFVALADLPG